MSGHERAIELVKALCLSYSSDEDLYQELLDALLIIRAAIEESPDVVINGYIRQC